MDGERRLGLVADEIQSAIVECALPPGFAALLRLALAQEGKTLAGGQAAVWPLLTLAACEAASGGEWRHAVPAAAGVELLVVAFDLIDDLQDGDPHPVVSASGSAQALNVSTGLIILSQRLFLRLADRGVPAGRVLAALREVVDAAAVAGGGQYLDLALEQQPATTSEEALDVAARKSAALVALACRVGAQLGGADAGVVDLLGRFGWHAGLAAQLANDLWDSRDAGPAPGAKSDRRRGKPTLPLTAAAAFAAAETAAPSGGAAGDADESTSAAAARHYAWVVADLHRQEAVEVLSALGPEHPTEGLVALLPTL